jgi:hypothetical protein
MDASIFCMHWSNISARRAIYLVEDLNPHIQLSDLPISAERSLERIADVSGDIEVE